MIRPEGYERNTAIPVFMWIKCYDSILKIPERPYMSYKFTGKDMVEEVLERFVRLYHVDVTQFNDLVDRLIQRYRSTWNAMPDDVRQLAYSDNYQGRVYVTHDQKYGWATVVKYSAEYSDAYVELQRMESCSPTYMERQLKLIAEEQRKPEYKGVKVIAVKEKTKVVNRLTKSWYRHYLNIRTEPVKVPKLLNGINDLVEIPAMHPPGVYFLCQGSKVVYVGKSINPSSRIAQHQADKQFNRVFMIPTNDMDNVEQMYIRKLKPKYNIVHNDG